MFPANPALLQGETLLKREVCTRHGYGRDNAMVLTDRRLIFKTLYSEEWFPLSHIKSVSKTGNILRVEFDNGRTETISTFSADAWMREIEKTRTSAPGMDYPPRDETPHQAYSGFIVVLIAGAAVIGFITFCIVVATFLYLWF